MISSTIPPLKHSLGTSVPNPSNPARYRQCGHVCTQCGEKEDRPGLEKVSALWIAFTDPRKSPSFVHQIGVGLFIAAVAGVFSWGCTLIKKPSWLPIERVGLIALLAIFAYNLKKGEFFLNHDDDGRLKDANTRVKEYDKDFVTASNLIQTVLRCKKPSTNPINEQIKELIQAYRKVIQDKDAEIASLKASPMPLARSSP